MVVVIGKKWLDKSKKIYLFSWEQRKLGDECSELIAGGDIDKTRCVNDGKYPIYANALTNEGIIGYYNDSYKVKAPAVTITGRGEIGYAMARNTDFTPVVRLISLKSKHNNYFLANSYLFSFCCFFSYIIVFYLLLVLFYNNILFFTTHFS